MRLRTAARERDGFEPNFPIYVHSLPPFLLRDLRATAPSAFVPGALPR